MAFRRVSSRGRTSRPCSSAYLFLKLWRLASLSRSWVWRRSWRAKARRSSAAVDCRVIAALSCGNLVVEGVEDALAGALGRVVVFGPRAAEHIVGQSGVVSENTRDVVAPILPGERRNACDRPVSTSTCHLSACGCARAAAVRRPPSQHTHGLVPGQHPH